MNHHGSEPLALADPWPERRGPRGRPPSHPGACAEKISAAESEAPFAMSARAHLCDHAGSGAASVEETEASLAVRKRSELVTLASGIVDCVNMLDSV